MAKAGCQRMAASDAARMAADMEPYLDITPHEVNVQLL